jgi:hypothetical protein
MLNKVRMRVSLYNDELSMFVWPIVGGSSTAHFFLIFASLNSAPLVFAGFKACNDEFIMFPLCWSAKTSRNRATHVTNDRNHLYRAQRSTLQNSRSLSSRQKQSFGRAFRWQHWYILMAAGVNVSISAQIAAAFRNNSHTQPDSLGRFCVSLLQ